MLVPGTLRAGSANRVALVTGASGAIGERVVDELLASGYSVLAQYRDLAKAGGLERLAESTGGLVEPVQANLADPVEVERLVSSIGQRYSTLDCLVHSAAPSINPAPLLHVDDDDFLQHLTVQVTAFARLTRHVVPLMQRQQRGVIVGVLSVVLDAARPKQWWPYTTAKFAECGLLSGLSTDLEGSGVRVAGILPSGVLGTLSREAGVRQEHLLEPAAVARLIRRIATEPSNFANGCFVRIDPEGIAVGRVNFVGSTIPA